jgi:membrane fusion protein, multidrug efflux system
MLSKNVIRVIEITAIITSSLIIDSCHKSDGKQISQGGAGRNLIPVEAQIISPQLLRNKITTTGTLMANEEVQLRPEISGRVIGVYFEEGRRVQKGELLLKINDREIKAKLKQIEVQEKQAAIDEERNRQLFDINGISKEDFDKYQNSLQMVRAEKEALESQLAETEINAPFDGIIGLRYVSEGGYITPDILVASMQDIDPIKVEFSVPEKYAGLLKTGANIVVRVGDSEDSHQGLVYAVESKIDLDTRTIKARAKIPNPKGALIPGAFAKIEITLEEIPDAIVVPSESIVPQINGDMVYICRNGKASIIPVTTGIRTESGVQVTEGLSPLDTLITSGLLQVANGKGVQIKALKAN